MDYMAGILRTTTPSAQKAELYKDAVHFTEKGYDRLAEIILSEINHGDGSLD